MGAAANTCGARRLHRAVFRSCQSDQDGRLVAGTDRAHRGRCILRVAPCRPRIRARDDSGIRISVGAGQGEWRLQGGFSPSVNALNPGAYADLGRAPTFSDTLVELEVAAVAAAAE
jgi:hypothetical protein